jgi:hypothetical protein
VSGPRPPFNTTLRRDPAQGPDLHARVEAELGARIAEAVDFVCLEAMVEERRARGLPAPAADSARDRAEFDAGVRDFLERLRRDVAPDASEDLRRRVDDASRRAPADDAVAALLAAQVALAKALPDYWQRFETVRGAWTPGGAPASGGERRSVLRRLFGGA